MKKDAVRAVQLIAVIFVSFLFLFSASLLLAENPKGESQKGDEAAKTSGLYQSLDLTPEPPRTVSQPSTNPTQTPSPSPSASPSPSPTPPPEELEECIDVIDADGNFKRHV